MSETIIATSSTADLPAEWLAEHGVPCIPYPYTVNDELFEDDCREESRAAVYAGMRRGSLLKTSMISEFAYQTFFRSLLETGRDVIFLDMSGKLSASFANARNAAETVRVEFPDRRLCVMDTRCVSGGLGLLVMNLVRLHEAGADFDALVAWGEANKLRIAHRFTVDDLKYLKMGGRVSNASALVGSLLDIKPVLYVPDAGTLDVVKKARGRRAALNAILNSVCGDLSAAGTAGTEIHILHADCLSDAEWLRGRLREQAPQAGEIDIRSLGVVIGAHCGPGLLTVFYLCGGRVP